MVTAVNALRVVTPTLPLRRAPNWRLQWNGGGEQARQRSLTKRPGRLVPPQGPDGERMTGRLPAERMRP
jgi:hypothetical protein